MSKHYIFFTRNVLPQPKASLVQVANSANAAANLGYSTVLLDLQKGLTALNPIKWIHPFEPHKPEEKLTKFYTLQHRLKVAHLPIPWPIDRVRGKLTNSSTIITKYYLPFYIRPHTQLVHSRDWNFVKAAVQLEIPAIYEHHHYDNKQFEPEIVHNPLFQLAVTVADPVKESMLQKGMPAEKLIKLHNGFNQMFLERHPDAAKAWRKQLLARGHQHLVVYSGAMYPFKGVDVLIEAAQKLPQIQFVFAGGNESQVDAYKQLVKDKQIQNVTFLGYVIHEHLPSLLQAADILAHPHCSGEAATFTSPLKLFEYMASGTPIVATEIPPLMEFKTSGAIAAWCEPDNPTQFAQCIQQVLVTHPRKPDGYTETLEFVRQFSWENRITKILSYVDEEMHPSKVG